MPDDHSPKDQSWPPPPMDPFPTYQSSFPRSKKDDEQNPFIQFRRFADEQFSTFFSGVPNFFGLSPPSSGDPWKKNVEDIMRQRQEWEEGFRKQFEQEMEEMRQQMEKSKSDAWKSMEDAWKQHAKPEQKNETPAVTPWWTRGNAVKCPALNGQEPQKNAEKCPALYDEQGQPRTELDAYNALRSGKDKEVQVFQAPTQDGNKIPTKSWLPSLGFDGMQKEMVSTNASVPQEEQNRPSRSFGRPTTYSLWNARRMQPFDNSDETIPWLMLSPYSPIYLCNPAQSRLFKVKVQDSVGAPLQVARTRFFERWYTEVDEKMATQKPWADAFEDLLSLQQTGKMVVRDNWNTWRTPSTWIHDMASRGSLGDRWGFNDEGLLVKRADPTKAISELPGSGRDDRCARWRKNRECRRNSPAELPATTEEPVQEENVIVEKVTEALLPFPLFGSILSAADAIVSAVDQATQEESQTQVEPIISAPSADFASLIVPPEERSITSSSDSSTSSDNILYAPSDSNSVVSTLTSIVTRTLPDGSIETKRVLKRRFSDGSEESDERLEVQHASIGSSMSSKSQDMPLSLSPPVTNDKETQTQARPEAKEIHERGESRPPRQIRFIADDVTGLQEPKLQAQISKPRRDESKVAIEPEQEPRSQNNDNPRRRGSGWFWN